MLLRRSIGSSIVVDPAMLPLPGSISTDILRKGQGGAVMRAHSETTSWQNSGNEVDRHLPVLMYHHIGSPRPGAKHSLFISSDQFEEQMRFLARRGYVGIRVSDWLLWQQNHLSLPKKPLLITFDDGFADLNDYAFPVLERYGFSALVFVVTNCVGKTNVWDQPHAYTRHECLTAEQIQRWSRMGIEFGAHSRTHPDLTTLAESDLRDEVAGSRSDLEKIIGSPVNSFAYPYGAYNVAVTKCVGEHFLLAFTTVDGVNTLRTDHHLLYRSMVYPCDTLLDLECLVRWAQAPIRRLRARLRIRSHFLNLTRRMRIFRN